MKRYLYALRYLISIHVLGLILFTAFRLILFLQGYEYLMDEEISVFTRLEAFVRGLWLDNVVACYISILPLVIVSLCSLIGYFGKNLYRGIHIFFSVFYVVAFAISAVMSSEAPSSSTIYLISRTSSNTSTLPFSTGSATPERHWDLCSVSSPISSHSSCFCVSLSFSSFSPEYYYIGLVAIYKEYLPKNFIGNPSCLHSFARLF